MKLLLFLTIASSLLGQAAYAEQTSTCQPPYEPSSIVEVVVRYSEAMDYIASAPDSCRKPFAKQFTDVFRKSWLVPDGCLAATVDDVQVALDQRKNPLKKQSTDGEEKL